MVDSNSVIGILLGCALLGGMIYWFRELQKKQGRPIGEILTIGAVTQIETLLMFLTMITYGSEAMTAANVSVEGHVMPNIMARMALHMVISFVGWLCEVTLARDLASVFEKGLDSGSRIARIALALFVILFTIKVPLWNLELIAANLGQDATFGLYLYSLVPWHSAKDVSDLCVLYGYPANYSPWANLEPILRASFIATYVTVGLAAIAGLRNIGSKERRSLVFGTLMKGSDDKKKDTDDPDIRKFCLENSIHECFMEQATDMKYYFMTITEIVLSRDASKIVNIKNLDAVFCRLEKANNGKINHVFYGDFGRQTPPQNAVAIPLLDPINPLGDLETRLGKRPLSDTGQVNPRPDKNRKFAILTRFPTPGCRYYPIPYYVSMFKDNWYDIYRLIGIGKKEMEHCMRRIIYSFQN